MLDTQRSSGSSAPAAGASTETLFNVEPCSPAASQSDSPAMLSGTFQRLRDVDPETTDIETVVRQLSASWQPYRPIVERREHHRMKHVVPMTIIPLNDETGELQSKRIEATGRDISSHGISFFHPQHLSERRVFVIFGRGDMRRCYCVDLRWSRYRGGKKWVSGGYFEKSVSREDPEWDMIERRLNPA